MKVMYNGKQIFEVTTNHSMSIEDVLELMGLDNEEAIEKAYEEGAEYVYCEDGYFVDVENMKMEY